MAQPVLRELLLQPRRLGGGREDLADAFIGDRDDSDDSRVGLLALSEELERVPRWPADPDRAPAVLPMERHVNRQCCRASHGASRSRRPVDVGDELPPPQLHELADAGARTVERLDDGAIARLPFNRGQQPEDLDLFQAALGPTRHDFGQPQGSPNVEPQRAHLEAGGQQRFDRRERPPAGRGRTGQGGSEVREVAQADRAQTARPDEGPEAAVVALSPMYGKDPR
jgi:hypothetical protein